MTKEQKEAEIVRLETCIREELAKLTLWEETGEWSLVVIGRTFKEYRSDTLQPLLNIFQQAMEWNELCRGQKKEWREWRIVKNDIAPMGIVTIPFREVYCFLTLDDGKYKHHLLPPLEPKGNWDKIREIAAEDLVAKSAIAASKGRLSKTEEPTNEISMFLKTI